MCETLTSSAARKARCKYFFHHKESKYLCCIYCVAANLLTSNFEPTGDFLDCELPTASWVATPTDSNLAEQVTSAHTRQNAAQ